MRLSHPNSESRAPSPPPSSSPVVSSRVRPRAPPGTPPPKSVMHAASSLHDLLTLPGFRNSCAPPPIFMLPNIPRTTPTTDMLYSRHMAAKKKPTKKPKATLESVLSTVERGFADLEAKIDRGFAAVADDITDIKSKMATKDDIANLGGQLTSVERELKSIRRDLDDLREKGRECLRLPERNRSRP
jgi:hypothetical protein